MKRSVILIATAALGAALAVSQPAAAFRAGAYHGRTLAGRSVAYHHGWRGGHWRYGWRGAGWRRYGWRGGWGNRWAWSGGWPGYTGWGLGGLGLGLAAANPWNYGYGYGYPYSYGYGYGYPYGYPYGYGLAGALTAPVAAATTVAEATTAPLMTGRSVAASGDHCATPETTCKLYHPSWVGNGCSCKVSGAWVRGSVTP